ncbi:DUF898 family protein [Devosia epidermidihirudinis]|uniref:DUF898 family protein n=1 Tax=Devosia epidermidihirudinis TaxID=1293439 RepID=UPI000695C04A|nr:DUF898 family protein [Devosia epidermidihirudinis]
MVWGVAEERAEPVVFTGTRRELGGTLVRGYGFMLPTIGLYRFWLTSWKRRFYWSNTEIGGDCLEYTGNAVQLLLGFLMAVAIFLPIYVVFFYLSTLSSDAAVIGYGGVAILIWFMMGYAIYRARDFRLSRTLWRGIRLDQAGSAWGYALRRFGWSLAMIATLGLIYPLMAANLWRYRYSNSWFGDRQFSFVGHWRQLAGPYYLSYVLVAVIGGTGVAMSSFVGTTITNLSGIVPTLAAAVPVGLIVLFYQSRELTRMFSAVRLGQAALTVRVSMFGLLGPYIRFGFAVIGAYVVLAIGGFVVLNALAGDAFAGGTFSLAIFMQHMQGSFTTLAAIIFGYLLLLGAFTMMSELFLGLGYWKLIASNASVSGLDSLTDVRARAEDKALAGEGLADALNVGSY